MLSRPMRRLPATLAVLAALGLGLTVARAQPEGPPHPETGYRLVANVYTRNSEGRVFCAIWRGRDGYPTRRAQSAGEALDRTIENRTAQCVFDGVTPGPYALAAFHDENGNNDLDRNLLGIPSEGTGASNGAFNMFGPPSYDDAMFRMPDAPLHQITVHIRY